jgi:hypothetical protein
MFGGTYFAGAVFAGALGAGLGPLPTAPTDAAIVIGGLPVTARVRVSGLTIHDILNDAPNTASLTIEGEAPAVGQSITITVGARLLFSGTIQTMDQAYESRPDHLAWHLTAIDDTAAANARRPFGAWVNTSATTIAQAIAATYAPSFATTGIAAGLPPVTIIFDGADLFIACLTRLATAIGGYCKIENRTVYLFLEDTAQAPAAIDDAHRFLANPPITMNTDVSQIRTRVYGKGYGETVTADLAAGETRWPIQDGAMFPPLGGTAIAGLTADGAQSEKIAFTGVDRGGGGSLVGTGSSPTNAPLVQLQGGTGVTDGLHTLSVGYLTAAGRSLAGPPASITAGIHPPPVAAPTAGTAVTGTGPDQGTHDYAVSFLTAYGETIPGPISNPITTSAASGQLPPPASSGIGGTFQVGAGLDPGTHDYKTTFVNAQGETDAPSISAQFTPGRTAPAQANAAAGTLQVLAGGNIEDGHNYFYFLTVTTAAGESLPNTVNVTTAAMVAGFHSANVDVAGQAHDPRITAIKIYRSQDAATAAAARLVHTVSSGVMANQFWLDTIAHASIAGAPTPPTVDTTTEPAARLSMSGIALGPAGTTGRRLYRRFNASGTWKRVTSITNNTATTYLDTTPNSGLGVDVPASNTTGTAVQRIPITNMPIGPAGVTARNLYRRFNGASLFRLVTTFANNTTTNYTDSAPNSALGPVALETGSAVGNQIAVTVPVGPTAVTARELYMSPAGGSPRRLIQTIADNTTIAVTVATPDAGITGALEPVSDTSGLQQPSGQVNPGSTVLPVASPAPFRPGGGWVTLGGGQVVKHTGVSGNTLTGIPASGSGAITTTVTYGSQAIPAPMLTGVTGLTRALAKGGAVHIWIQRDDLQAQVEHAARTGGDGIVEFLIVDARRGVESLAARCDADLKLFSRPLVTVRYATRDLLTRSGKTIRINLPSQGISQTLTIQDVTITEIDLVRGLAPRFTVTASSVRFSFEDTLRRLIAGGQTTVNT